MCSHYKLLVHDMQENKALKAGLKKKYNLEQIKRRELSGILCLRCKYYVNKADQKGVICAVMVLLGFMSLVCGFSLFIYDVMELGIISLVIGALLIIVATGVVTEITSEVNLGRPIKEPNEDKYEMWYFEEDLIANILKAEKEEEIYMRRFSKCERGE